MAPFAAGKACCAAGSLEGRFQAVGPFDTESFPRWSSIAFYDAAPIGQNRTLRKTGNFDCKCLGRVTCHTGFDNAFAQPDRKRLGGRDLPSGQCNLESPPLPDQAR